MTRSSYTDATIGCKVSSGRRPAKAAACELDIIAGVFLAYYANMQVEPHPLSVAWPSHLAREAAIIHTSSIVDVFSNELPGDSSDDWPDILVQKLIGNRLHHLFVEVVEDVSLLMEHHRITAAGALMRRLCEIFTHIAAIVLSDLDGHNSTVARRYHDWAGINQKHAVLDDDWKSRRATMRAKYGQEFDNRLGWAAPLVPGRLSIVSLLRSLALDDVAAVYESLSRYVHVQPLDVLAGFCDPAETVDEELEFLQRSLEIVTYRELLLFQLLGPTREAVDSLHQIVDQASDLAGLST